MLIPKDYTKTVIAQVDVVDNKKGDTFVIELVNNINKEGLIESSLFQVRIDILTFGSFSTTNLAEAYAWIRTASLDLY
jgi:hypothetical protein